jgi:hypothetical protein
MVREKETLVLQAGGQRLPHHNPDLYDNDVLHKDVEHFDHINQVYNHPNVDDGHHHTRENRLRLQIRLP